MRSNLIIMKGALKEYKNRWRIAFDEIQKKSIRNRIHQSEQNKREQKSQKLSKKKNKGDRQEKVPEQKELIVCLFIYL